MVIGLLLLISLVRSGTLCLDRGWKITWTFLKDDQIQFKLQMNKETLEKYQWAGLGFKAISSSKEIMLGADVVFIEFGAEVKDSFTTCYKKPTEDTELGGHDNLSNVSYDEKSFTYTWNRPVNSGDSLDFVYEEGTKGNLLWACGKIFSGVPIKHLTPDRGVVEVELTEDFSLGCEELIEL